MTKYIANVIISTCVEVEVEVQNEEEAVKLALKKTEDPSLPSDRWEYEVDEVYKEPDDDDYYDEEEDLDDFNSHWAKLIEARY